MHARAIVNVRALPDERIGKLATRRCRASRNVGVPAVRSVPAQPCEPDPHGIAVSLGERLGGRVDSGDALAVLA